MSGRVVPMRFGDVDVLVETLPVAGTEPTSALDRAAEQVTDLAQRAGSTVRAVAESMAGAMRHVVDSSVGHPDTVVVEVGLGVSATGRVVLVSGQANASLKITLTYATAAGSANPPA